MVLPEWEQIYSLSASTACIPVQNFCRFRRVPTSQWATTFCVAGLPAIAFYRGNRIRTDDVTKDASSQN